MPVYTGQKFSHAGYGFRALLSLFPFVGLGSCLWANKKGGSTMRNRIKEDASLVLMIPSMWRASSPSLAALALGLIGSVGALAQDSNPVLDWNQIFVDTLIAT